MKKIFLMLLIVVYAFTCIGVSAHGFDMYCSNHILDSEYNDVDEVTFIVELEGDPLALSHKEQLTSKRVEDLYTQSSHVREQEILNNQTRVFNEVKSAVSDELELDYTYTTLFNGFAFVAEYGDLENIKNVDGVKEVYVSQKIKFEPNVSNAVSVTHTTPDAVLGYSGKGQLIAVLDNEFEVSHDAFSGTVQDPFYDKSGINNVLNAKELSIENKNTSLDGDDVYFNPKIPFRYDYGEGDVGVALSNQCHGTHVAGIAAGNDGIEGGFRGVAPDAQLLLMKVTDDNGYFDDATILAALNDAVALGADVINCSFGSPYRALNATPSVYTKCYDDAYKAGVFVSASAGNHARGFYKKTPKPNNIDYSAIGVPTAFESVTSVGSVSNNIASVVSGTSSYGPTESLDLKPEVSAPGMNIRSSVINNSYRYLSGTSMSAPHIAGVVAIVNEYLDKTGCDLVGNARVDRIQNLLMSTADVSYQPSSSGEKTPFSPRVQGAGVVNTSDAIKTPVILHNDQGRTKILLGDGLSNQIQLKFFAKNITDSPVTYKGINIVALTDGYTNNATDGLLVADAKKLRILSHTFDDQITIEANSIKEISGTITLDPDELQANGNIFRNGFYIDGFIRLESGDDIPDVGIPYLGFYGRWGAASVFDSTMYSANGSTLVYNDDSTSVYGTFLYSKMGGGSVDLGYDPVSGKYNKDMIAISPNSDGSGDDLYLYITPMRSIKGLSLTIWKGDSLVINPGTYNKVLSKFLPATIGLSNLDTILTEGDYTLKISGKFDYDANNVPTQAMSIPFYVDKTDPTIDSVVVWGEEVIINARDNRGIGAISVYNESNDDSDIITFSEIVKSKIVHLKLSNSQNIDLSKIEISVMDNAYNMLDVVADSLGGNITQFKYNDNSFTATFGGFKAGDVTNSTVIVAFYDEDGRLICASVENEATVTDGRMSISGNGNIKDAAECRVFIWNGFSKMKPVIIKKSFDLVS